MSESDIIRCDYCGNWMFRKHEICPACSKLNRQTTKGISHAESNPREENMLAVSRGSDRA